MTFDVLCIAVVALFWGSYPLVSRSAGTGVPLATLVLSIAGLVPIAVAAYWHGASALPSAGSFARIVVAGVMMGVGTLAFNWVANSELEASISIPVIDTAMLLISTLGAIYFFGETISAQKVLGLALLVAGIALLRPGS
jgi:drug/metabolite transporter (DMT)-like permease